MTTPRWATKDRKARLVQLWRRYGNRCFHGHPQCGDETHYTQRVVKPGLATVPDRMVRAERPDGTLILDSKGQPIYYQTYRLVPAPMVRDEVKHVPLGLGLIAGFLQPSRLYGLGDREMDEAIRYWVSDDAAQRMAEWKAERERLHRDQRHFRQGQFDSLRRQIYQENQPPYTIVALTVDSLTFRPVALVKVSSTIIHLFVDLPNPMVGLSKNARRKARRYGKGLPEEAVQKAERAIAAAVQDWWAKRK